MTVKWIHSCKHYIINSLQISDDSNSVIESLNTHNTNKQQILLCFIIFKATTQNICVVDSTELLKE